MSIRILLLICSAIFASCSQDSTTGNEHYQKSRSNIENVREKVHVFEPDEVIASTLGRIRILGPYVVLSDYMAADFLINVFDKNSLSFLGKFGDVGQGPGEISNLGGIAYDDERELLYVTDFGGNRIFSYDVDSALTFEGYQPWIRQRVDDIISPTEFTYVNDTVSYGVIAKFTAPNTALRIVGRWNIKLGTVQIHEHCYPNIPVKAQRVSFAYSKKYNVLAEVSRRYDLINIFDGNLNLICRVFGPQWNKRGDDKKHFTDVAIFKKWIIAAYEGSDYDPFLYPHVCHVFTIEGEYVKSLDIGCPMTYISCDEDNERLYFSSNGEPQFGYLDLKELLE